MGSRGGAIFLRAGGFSLAATKLRGDASCGWPRRGFLSTGWGFLIADLVDLPFIPYVLESFCFSLFYFSFFCGIYSADSFLVFEPFMADLY